MSTSYLKRVSQTKHDMVIKLLLLGNSGVGKTSLIMRYVEDCHNYTFLPTVGIDFKEKTLNYDNLKVKLQLWDTAGQEKYFSITKSYFRGIQGIILVYDITDYFSYKNLETWLRNIAEHAPSYAKIIIVGNKCDLSVQRAVPLEEGESKAEYIGSAYFESSAKEGINVTEVFEYLAEEIIQQQHTTQQMRNSNLDLSQVSAQNKKDKNGGCGC